MRHTLSFLFALAISLAALQAGDALEPEWNQVCRVAGGHEMVVTTSDGTHLEGYCTAIDVNGIRLQTPDGKFTTVARKTLTKLEMYRTKGHQLGALQRDVHSGLKWGTERLLSPHAAAGLVAVPAVLAWGAFSAPFCVLGDLVHDAAGLREIRPLPDSSGPIINSSHS